MVKPTFEEFLKNIYGMSLYDYHKKTYDEQILLEADYKNRYGKLIRWWD